MDQHLGQSEHCCHGYCVIIIEDNLEGQAGGAQECPEPSPPPIHTGSSGLLLLAALWPSGPRHTRLCLDSQALGEVPPAVATGPGHERGQQQRQHPATGEARWGGDGGEGLGQRSRGRGCTAAFGVSAQRASHGRAVRVCPTACCRGRCQWPEGSLGNVNRLSPIAERRSR